MINRIITTIILIAAALTFSSCQDEPDIAKDVKTVDVYYNTRIEGMEDIYIYVSENFFEAFDSWIFKDLGTGASLTLPVVEEGSDKATIISGHYYQFTESCKWSIIDNENVYLCGSKYYGVYVDSYMYGKHNNRIGVRLKYVENISTVPGMLKSDSTIELSMKHGKGSSVSYTFDKDFIVGQDYRVTDLNFSHVAKYISVKADGNKVTITNNSEMGGQVQVRIGVRKGNIGSFILFKLRVN